MYKFDVVIDDFYDGTAALNNIQKGFFAALERVFTIGHGQSQLDLILADWNNRATSPFEDYSSLDPFGYAQIAIYALENPTISRKKLSRMLEYLLIRLTLRSDPEEGFARHPGYRLDRSGVQGHRRQALHRETFLITSQ